MSALRNNTAALRVPASNASAAQASGADASAADASAADASDDAAPLCGSWHWNVRTGKVSFDPAWCASLDIACSPADGALERWIALIHPDESEAFRRVLMDAQLGSATRFELEYRVMTRTHGWVWLLHRARLVSRDVLGEPHRFEGLCLEIGERREREQRARVNESRLQTALWGARAAFWQWHLPTDARSESALWFAMTGYSREAWEQAEDPWRSKVHPADWPGIEQALKRFCQGGEEGVSYEYRLRVADGRWRWMLDRARAVEWDLDGRPAMLMGVSLDIEAQKSVEAALRESEARLQAALWGARVGMWEVTLPEDRVRWFDDWCERHDIEPCDGDGHSLRWLQRIHPDDISEVSQRYADHLAGQRDSYDADYRVQTRDGGWRQVVVRGRIVARDVGGEPTRLIGICMDMGELKATAAQWHHLPQWAEAALALGRLGLWHWQAHSNVDLYSDSYYRLLGFKPDDARADPDFWRHQMHPDDFTRIRTLAFSVADGTREDYDEVYRMRHANGHWVTVHEHAGPLLRNADGSAPVIVGCVEALGEGEGTPALEL